MGEQDTSSSPAYTLVYTPTYKKAFFLFGGLISWPFQLLAQLASSLEWSRHRIRTICRTWFLESYSGTRLFVLQPPSTKKMMEMQDSRQRHDTRRPCHEDKRSPRLFLRLDHRVQRLFVEPSDIEVQVFTWKLPGQRILPPHKRS